MDRERHIFRDGAVYTEGKSIRYVGPTDALDIREADVVIDGRGKLVMPGLIDTHVHLAQALIRGCADDVALVDWLKDYVWVLQGNFTAEDGRVSAELCMAEMIRTGTTAFIECMIHSRYGFDGIAEAVERAGMRAALSKIIMDSTGYADNPDIMYPGMVEDADECLRETNEMHRKWHGAAGERIQVWYGLRSLGAVSDDLFREVINLADEKDTRMTMHLGEVVDDVRFVRERGFANLTDFARSMGLLRPNMVLAHGIHFEDREIPILAEHGCHVAHCPASNLKLASGFAKVPLMLRHGVSVSIGCDGGPSNNTYDMMREMRLAALVHKAAVNDPLVVTAEQAIEMATLGGAAAMGLQGQVGALVEGMLADFIVVDMKQIGLMPNSNPVSNLVYAGCGHYVETVVVDGQVLMHEGRLLTIDEESVMTRAQERSRELLERSGVEIRPKWPVS